MDGSTNADTNKIAENVADKSTMASATGNMWKTPDAAKITRLTTRSSTSQDRADLLDFVIKDHAIDETLAIYETWASNYEEDMAAQKYNGPKLLAQYIFENLKLPKTAVILDVGCGTGLVGAELAKCGYLSVEGVDMSEQMMSFALPKVAYFRTFREKILKEKPFEEIFGKKYDCVCLCGTLLPGHVGLDCLDDLVKLLRQNGVIVWISRSWKTYEDTSDHFKAENVKCVIENLEKNHNLKLIEKIQVEGYLTILREKLSLIEKKSDTRLVKSNY